jgi:hypothetical protein
MHYKIAPGILVKSENAAKPASQSSAYLSEILKKLPRVQASFDFGCGKLRYANKILSSSDTLAVVDSEIQLSRRQTLRGVTTSIRDLVRKSNRLAAYDNLEFENLSQRFERGFCINVLSVVPIYVERQRILKSIASHLQSGSQCLFVVQYRNSDFTRMSRMPNARPWRDGFLINSLRGYSFYGLISPARLMSMLKRSDFHIEDVKLNDGSAYVWASRS